MRLLPRRSPMAGGRAAALTLAAIVGLVGGPVPVVPESKTPVYLGISAIVVVVVAVALGIRRARRRAP